MRTHRTSSIRLRAAGWLAVGSMVALALLGPSAGGVAATDKETICHATGNGKYLAIVISTDGGSDNIKAGHLNEHEDDFLLPGEQTNEICELAANPSPSPSPAPPSPSPSPAPPSPSPSPAPASPSPSPSPQAPARVAEPAPAQLAVLRASWDPANDHHPSTNGCARRERTDNRGMARDAHCHGRPPGQPPHPDTDAKVDPPQVADSTDSDRTIGVPHTGTPIDSFPGLSAENGASPHHNESRLGMGLIRKRARCNQYASTGRCKVGAPSSADRQARPAPGHRARRQRKSLSQR